MAMFKLGYLKSAEGPPEPGDAATIECEAFYKDIVFSELYAYPFSHLVDPAKTNFAGFSKKALEILELSAMLASCSSFRARNFVDDNVDHVRFRALGAELVRDYLGSEKDRFGQAGIISYGF